MKTYKKLFNKICSFENLHLAYLKARKAKRYRPYVLEFSRNLEENLLSLQRDLINLTYKPGPYREFIVCDSKKRQIKAPEFRDRIVHHALLNVIEPIFDKGFISDSYACRKNKGVHRAVKRLEYFLRSLDIKSQFFCLKCDISKYFESINHKILFKLLQKKIADQKVLILLKKIIDSTPGEKGIPIGNLTSQLFANIYLNEQDQFIKHRLGCRYYIRYMDDFLILDSNKNKLHYYKDQISIFLRKQLMLEFHPTKANIFPIDGGIEFLGYIVFKTHRLLRKSTVKRFCRRMRRYKKRAKLGLMNQEKIRQAMDSWFSYACHANFWRLRWWIEQGLGLKFRK
jgi:retron-type reverse transcriptase